MASYGRKFLKGASAAVFGAPLVIPASALGREGDAAPSERITVGAIGLGERCRTSVCGTTVLAHVRQFVDNF